MFLFFKFFYFFSFFFIFNLCEDISFHICSKPKKTNYQIELIDIEHTMYGYDAAIYGTSDIYISCGNLYVNVWLKKIQIYKNQYDLCHHTACPVLVNEPNVVIASINQTLPAGLYYIQIIMDTKCKNCIECSNLVCVEFDYEIM